MTTTDSGPAPTSAHIAAIVSATHRVLERAKFLHQRIVASARAGTWFGKFRRSVRFKADAIEQNGTLLLMPREPSFAFYYIPLCIVFVAGGAILGALS